MQNSEARKRKEEQLSLFDQPHETRVMPVQETIGYLEVIRGKLLLMDEEGAFNYVNIVINGLKDGEL